MPLLFLLVFIAVPIIEIVLLIQVGGMIGWIPTILIVILTAIAGTTLLRQQGFGVMARAAETLSAGRMPVEHVLEGACLLVAGAFLLTPGLITDTVGFLLLIPPIRIAVAKGILSRLIKSGNLHVFTAGGHGGPGRPEAEPEMDVGPGNRSGRAQGPFRRPGGDRRGGGDKGAGRSRSGPIIEGDYERLDEESDPDEDRGGNGRRGS